MASYRFIEARFQLLDDTVAKIEKSKCTKLNASNIMRETVHMSPGHVIAWMHPKRPKKMNTFHRNKGNGTTASTTNQTNHDTSIHQNKRRTASMLQNQQKTEIPPLMIGIPPALHEWGQQNDEERVVIDPKEAKVHHAMHDSWQAIEKCLDKSSSLQHSLSKKRIPQLDDQIQTLPFDVFERNRLTDADHGQREHSKDCQIDEDESNVPRSDLLRREPATGHLMRRSTLIHPSQNLNWFSRQTTRTKERISSAKNKSRVRSASRRAATSSDTHDETRYNDNGCNDSAYYFLEIRLEHPTSLKGWRFRVIVTDKTALNQPAVLFNGMECNGSNCIVFGDPKETIRPTIFDPMKYFEHIQKPIDLYGHSLHIQVISEWPVQKTIVDTFVDFIDTNAGPLPNAEDLLGMLKLKDTDEPNPNEDEKNPPNSQDKAEQIVTESIESNSVADIADIPKKELISPRSPSPEPQKKYSPYAADIDAKKRELQRMRENMKIEMLREQKRLAGLR